MDPARSVIWRAGWLLLLPLLLQEGAQALECYSCVQKADDGCSPQKMKTVKCAPDADVCTEAVGAVETIHGQLSVAVRGCGSGLPGKNDRGLDLHGLLAFIQLQQCSQDLCNTKLNLTSRALNPAGHESAYKPNGIEVLQLAWAEQRAERCRIGTMGDEVLQASSSARCTMGGVVLTQASVTVSLPIKGCVKDDLCTRDAATGPGFVLSGSCCQGSRCNSDLRNKTYFAPRIPPLVRIPPSQHTTAAETTSVTTTTPAPTTTSSTTKPSPAPTSHTPPQEKKAEPEASQEKGPRLAGGAAGHQERSNVGQYPSKGGVQDSSKGSAVPMVGLATLLLVVVAGALL
uniref:LY6/PLAUR domain containing 3 n=1 Tax=Loxodonta africana TaxID=9785 RepID=G3TYI9_LOXAF